jgi:hypothetical protein
VCVKAEIGGVVPRTRIIGTVEGCYVAPALCSTG